MDTTHRYHAYVLRLWRDGEDAPWRASLESTHDGTQRHFTGLAQLLAFLEAQTGERLTVNDQQSTVNGQQ